jgi:hypothetical protein
MSNHHQNNYFSNNSDPTGQAEYLVQVAWNSQAQVRKNGLKYYGVLLLQPHAYSGYHENLGYNDFNQYPLHKAPISPSATYAVMQPCPLLPPCILSPSHSLCLKFWAILIHPSTTVATALVLTQPNTLIVSHCTEFSVKEYLGVTHTMVDINPFAAKYGQKGVACDKVWLLHRNRDFSWELR